MASVIFHFYNQIVKDGMVKIFNADQPEYKNGEQKRDFVYVDDVVDVCIFMGTQKPISGIYNVGTGKARSFNDLATAVFTSLGYKKNITYIDTPILIRDKYQYFTEAKINKLRIAGYKKPFHELEEGVYKYTNKLKNETC